MARQQHQENHAGEQEGTLQAGLYSSPAEALKKVSSEYEYWTSKLTEFSSQMSYALIGANWVVFGSLTGIRNNRWAELSLLTVILALATNLAGAWLLSEALRKRVEYGEANHGRWKDEFHLFAKTASSWPFTRSIETIGRSMRIVKAVFTLTSGAFLITGAILN